jgi:hypothetical protein
LGFENLKKIGSSVLSRRKYSEAVVIVSMGFFGLGVLGLSYGILSTS